MEKKNKDNEKIEYFIQDGEPFDMLSQDEIDQAAIKCYTSMTKDQILDALKMFPFEWKTLERLNLLYLIEK